MSCWLGTTSPTGVGELTLHSRLSDAANDQDHQPITFCADTIGTITFSSGQDAAFRQNLKITLGLPSKQIGLRSHAGPAGKQRFCCELSPCGALRLIAGFVCRTRSTVYQSPQAFVLLFDFLLRLALE